MGKIHTTFNSMSGQETERILTLDLRQDPIFQRCAHTPFQATLPGDISYLWKPQHGAHPPQSSENLPGTTKRHLSKRTEASAGGEETSGAVGGGEGAERGGRGEGGRRGRGGGRLRRTGLTPDWLRWFWRESHSCSSPVGSCPTFQQLGDPCAGASDRGGRIPTRAGQQLLLLLHPQLLTISALSAGAQGRKGRRKGGRWDPPLGGNRAPPHALHLVTWRISERVPATARVEGRGSPAALWDPSR